MLRLLMSVTAVTCLLVLTACGSSDDDSGNDTTTHTPTPIGAGNSQATGTGSAEATGSANVTPAAVLDPCSLVTQQEVAAAVGQAVGPGELQNDGEQCAWQYTDPADEFTGVGVTLYVNQDPEGFREDQQGGLGTVAVSGVGDEAYFTPGGLASLLDFRKGDQLFTVGINVAGDLLDQFTADAQQAAETQVATAALTRIS